MAVTLKQIAQLAGVSHQVVSKVLNGGANGVGASDATRMRIQKIARELGYRPDAASRALRRGRFHNIGILMGDQDMLHLPQPTLMAMSRELAKWDYLSSLICTSGYDEQALASNPTLKAKMVDVLLVSFAFPLGDAFTKAMDQMSIPVLWLNQCGETDCLSVDEEGATAQLVEHFACLGHTRVTFLAFNIGSDQAPHVQERLRGFDQSCESLGIEALHYTHHCVPRDQRQDAAAKWLENPRRSQAVIVNSLSAAQALAQTAMQMGLRIPEDVAIASYDDGNHYDANIPAITSAIRPTEAFGIQAARMALAKAEKPQVELPSRTLAFDLVIGGSTDPSGVTADA
ncbi:MAG: LacI family DNA-binding transcriptional regulator [Phycisphaeraceae bacterium JB051]